MRDFDFNFWINIFYFGLSVILSNWKIFMNTFHLKFNKNVSWPLLSLIYLLFDTISNFNMNFQFWGNRLWICLLNSFIFLCSQWTLFHLILWVIEKEENLFELFFKLIQHNQWLHLWIRICNVKFSLDGAASIKKYCVNHFRMWVFRDKENFTNIKRVDLKPLFLCF